MPAYETVVGLEVHVQVKTASKMFCSCPNKFGAAPNTQVCPVCMGMPGVMPSPNREAVGKTIVAGLMCSCEIAKRAKFDRKSYFYPDMPKNYQISQYDLPFCKNGKIHISGKGFSGAGLPDKNIGITRIHLEEDVAKLTHLAGGSGVDFNRAGAPLMEIVSEPDMSGADEAHAYLSALKQMMQYAGISDCDMEKGQLRCDVNISLMPVGSKTFGTKIELKNLNSFRAVHRAINHEIQRQSEILDAGGSLEQETRGWNDDLGETHLLRKKESAHDYRYFPEPDMLPFVFSDADIEAVKKSLPELPEARRDRFVNAFGLTPYDAQVLAAEKDCADYFEKAASTGATPKLVANWIISELLRELSNSNTPISECKISPAALGKMVGLIDSGAISGKIAKTIFTEMFASGEDPEAIMKGKNLTQVSDESEIAAFARQAVESNPAQAAQYKDNPKVLQFFVGQVMKLSKGKANPQIVQKLLKAELEK